MQAQILPTDTAADLRTAVDAAVRRLEAGELVGLPTETVYGLGADATNESAVLKIFEAKQRPRFDPLIVHLPSSEALEDWADIGSNTQCATILKIANAFWPGPLTIVLPHTSSVLPLVTSGLSTVALRVSAHPVFNEVITRLGRPIAAPSANRFGRISPTSAGHVSSELGQLIPLILDAGFASHGVESTVIALAGEEIQILRPGPITAEQLSAYGPVTFAAANSKLRSPGQLPSHYAPVTPLILVENLGMFELARGKRIGALAWKTGDVAGFEEFRCLSPKGDFREAAANLFRYLHDLDACSLDLIVAEELPELGLGQAIMDRLRRASAPR